jgi:hypothetical protein
MTATLSAPLPSGPDPLDLTARCEKLRLLRVKDKLVIGLRVRPSLAMQAYLRTTSGWRRDLPKSEQAWIKDVAHTLFLAIDASNYEPMPKDVDPLLWPAESILRRVKMVEEKLAKINLRRLHPKAGKDGTVKAPKKPVPVPPNFAEICNLFFVHIDAIHAADAQRKVLAAEMFAIVKDLPAFAWAESVKGFGGLSLAVLLGETGNLSRFRNRDCLVKRMGIAPPACYAMITKAGKTVHAVPRVRRSVLWVIGDNLIRTGNETYRAIYDEQKARRTLLRTADLEAEAKAKAAKIKALRDKAKATGVKLSEVADEEAIGVKGGIKMHIHRQSHRSMERKLLRDLFAAWMTDVK